MAEEDESQSKATFRFTVANFSKLQGTAYSSPTFIRNLPWKIMVMPRQSYDNDRNSVKCLGFFLQCNGESESSTWSCKASAELRIISKKKGVENFSRKIQHTFNSKEFDWGYSHFMLWNEVLDPEEGFIKDDAIVLEVAVTADAPHFLHDSKTLRKNFKELLLNDEKHDLILKVKDKELKAHQNILQCRCPVFKSMLDHDMLEKNTGVIEIPDCDPLAFEQFLIYVYTGDLETLDERVMLGLYYIADKYDMACLRKICSKFLKKSLSPHIVSDVIKLALNHSDSSLLECGRKYFVDNVKKILITEEWKSFLKENPNEANELFIKTINNYLPGEQTET